MIAAVKTLPVVGGVLDGKTRGVLSKSVCESSKHNKPNHLLGHDVRPACSLHSSSPVGRRVKSWAQSRLLSVRDKIGSIRLHRGQSNLARDVDEGLTRLCGGDAL